MRGPARVADAQGSGGGSVLQGPREAFVNLAQFFADDQTGTVQHRDARAVVAAILQPPQAFQQDGRGRFFSGVSDDAAHFRSSVNVGRGVDSEPEESATVWL